MRRSFDALLTTLPVEVLADLADHFRTLADTIDHRIADCALAAHTEAEMAKERAAMARVMDRATHDAESGKPLSAVILDAAAAMPEDLRFKYSLYRPVEVMIEARLRRALKIRKAEKQRARDDSIAGYALQGLTDSEIARRVGLHPVTVNRIVAKARSEGKLIPGRWKPRRPSARQSQPPERQR